MVGTQLFKPFVDMLYGLKDKNKKFKIILNVLWGLLCSRNIKKIQYNVTREFNYDFDTEKHSAVWLGGGGFGWFGWVFQSWGV